MLVGNDVSQFQTIDWNTFKNNANFVIIKASEGIDFLDPDFEENQNQVRSTTLPHGYYHFCRPDLGNDAAHEADFFLDTVKIQPGEFLALDYEVIYHDPVVWCKTFLDRITFMLNGYRPLIYLNQSEIGGFDWSPIAQNNGLWQAYYTYDPTKNGGVTGAWSTVAFQQWSNKQSVPGIEGNVDGDVFFGDLTALQKYTYQLPQPTPPPAPPAPDPKDALISELKAQVTKLQQQVGNRDEQISLIQGQLTACENKPPVTTTIYQDMDVKLTGWQIIAKGIKKLQGR